MDLRLKGANIRVASALALTRRGVIALVVADVALYFAATFTSQESPSHPSTGTVSTVLGLFFWFGVVLLIVIGVRAFLRRVRRPRDGRMTLPERAADAYLKYQPGVAEGMASVQMVAELDERLQESDERFAAEHEPPAGP